MCVADVRQDGVETHRTTDHMIEQGLIERLHAVKSALLDHLDQERRLFPTQDPFLRTLVVGEDLTCQHLTDFAASTSNWLITAWT